MEPAIKKRSREFSIFGIFMILLGIGLILHKLNLLHYGWKTIFWLCIGVAGLVSTVRAFVTRQRGVVFWGSLLFFVSIAMLVHRLALIDFVPWDVPATFSLAFGLAFLMLFFFEPRRFGVLIPVLLFCGYGILYYLWWWDVIDWFEMKYYFHTYWPVLIILWGLSMLFVRKRSQPQ
jgi:hypothetical protein